MCIVFYVRNLSFLNLDSLLIGLYNTSGKYEQVFKTGFLKSYNSFKLFYYYYYSFFFKLELIFVIKINKRHVVFELLLNYENVTYVQFALDS